MISVKVTKVWRFKKPNIVTRTRLRQIGIDTIRAVRRRVEDRGIDANGRKFPPYNDQWPKNIPSKRGWRRGFMLPKGGTSRFPLTKGLIPPGKDQVYVESYRDYRRKLGLPTDSVRFSLTGKTWKSIRGTTGRGHDSKHITCEPKQQRKKTGKSAPFLALSRQEKRAAVNKVKAWVREDMEKSGKSVAPSR